MEQPLPPLPPKEFRSGSPASSRSRDRHGGVSPTVDVVQPPPRRSSRSQHSSPVSSTRQYAQDQFAEPSSRPRKSREYNQQNPLPPPPSDQFYSQNASVARSSSNTLNRYNDPAVYDGRRPPSQPMAPPAQAPSPAAFYDAQQGQGPPGQRPMSSYPYQGPPPSDQFDPGRPYPPYAQQQGGYSDRAPSPGDFEGFYGTGQQIPRQPSPSTLAYQQTGGGGSIRPPSPGLLDHSHLRPGKQAALLSHEQTLALYRSNAKKTSDPDLIFEFAVFMLEASKSLAQQNVVAPLGANQIEVEKQEEKQEKLVAEALALLKRIADRGHVLAQYTLADCYANGLGTFKNKQDFEKAYPLFVLAAKHGHADAAYRAGTCCENGWGCRRDSAKAVQFFRKAASQQHPGSMYRMGLAELNGELGLNKNAKEGVKWLKRSAEHATKEFPHALHELALCHEKGIPNVVFVDFDYAAELFGQAAELGYAPSAYRLGEAYEYGRLGCPPDAALSIHYYNIAAQQSHRDACFALTAWYLVGSPGVLPQSDTEAFLWAKRAADAGLLKAMYATGYFYETGLGTEPSLSDATVYYKKAAEKGDKRALQRLRGTTHGPLPEQGGPGLLRRENDPVEGKDKKDCIIM